MKYFSHLNSSVQIIGLYKGQQPFHLFIKGFFRQEKKFGSSDRRTITHLCYCFFRLGKAFETLPVKERILIGLFLCSGQSSDLLAKLKPDWNAVVSAGWEIKSPLLPAAFSPQDIFPFTGLLSEHIDKPAFSLSHLLQPELFVRIRPGFKSSVVAKLTNAGLGFRLVNESCVALPNTTKIDLVLSLNKEAVVQDYSSQAVGGMIKVGAEKKELPIRVWDSCAASGGKSLLAKDLLGQISLTVSDIRESILGSLKRRFEQAGLKEYTAFCMDLTKPLPLTLDNTFDLIIADVPCSGSGTWGRTPEQLSYFDKSAIREYQSLQKKIVSTCIPFLKPGGHFIYITCSVFKQENEEVVDFIKEEGRLELVKAELFKGYSLKADTLFAALFKTGSK